jgi:hypothetical protein
VKILEKVRVRGINLILPSDGVIGDEPASYDMLRKCYTNVDKDGRDEGGDYDGDTVVKVFSDISSTVVDGYLYDIGPSSCQSIREQILACSVHLNWGTMGRCELSSFQGGQKALVITGIPKNPSSEEPVKNAPLSVPKPHNIVIGDSSVEWWGRISDSEGEYEGDLIKRHAASYFSRESSGVCGVLCNLPSHTLENTLYRESNSNEWDYFSKLRVVVVEEEEEDDADEVED